MGKRGVFAVIALLILLFISFSLVVFAQSEEAVEVDPFVESALNVAPEVNVIVILKEPEAPIAKDASAEAVLEETKAAVEEVKTEFLENISTPEPGFETSSEASPVVVTGTYETINVVAATVTEEGLEELKNNPAVEEIILEPIFHVGMIDTVPLLNANDVHNLSVAGTKLNGTGMIACVLDSGIELNHSAFTGRLLPGYDFINSDSSPDDDMANSHGTHVSGSIAGLTINGTGIAPAAQLIPIKTCNSTGGCSASALLSGIDYCNNLTSTYNISVLSMSISDGGQYTSGTCPTFFDTGLATSNSLGIIPVMASGNNGYTGGISYPACSPYTLSVGSTTKANAMSSFTNRGGDMLDVLAPGSSIISTIRGNTAGVLSGTSMATPHVSGLVLLMQQNEILNGRSELNLSQIRAILQETGVPVSGYQRVDAYNAIAKLNYNYTINNSARKASYQLGSESSAVTFDNTTDFSNFANCAALGSDFVYVNSSACPQFNKSASIQFTGIVDSNASPTRDGVACGSYCSNINFSGGVLTFNVSSFSNYSFEVSSNSSNNSILNISAHYTLNESYNGSIHLLADNIILDCAGHSINAGSEPAIRADGRTNITIRNCSISGDTDILFNGTSESMVAATQGNGSLIFMNSDDNTLEDLTLRSSSLWISTDSQSTGNEFTNLTFTNDVTSVSYSNVTAPANTNVNQSNFALSSGSVRVNGSQLSWLNTEAQITMEGLASAGSSSLFSPAAAFSQVPLIDLNDNGNFIPCPDSICNQTEFYVDRLIFTTQHFTTINSTSSFPVLINDSSTLTQNINVNGSAVTFNNNSISLDCQGFSMTGNGSGTGIAASSRNNITIRNCIVSNFTTQVSLATTPNSLVDNTTVNCGTSICLANTDSDNNTISAVRFNGTSGTLGNIQTSNNIQILNSNFTSTAGAVPIPIGNANNMSMINVTINANASESLQIGFATNSTFRNIFIRGNTVAIRLNAGSGNVLEDIDAQGNFTTVVLATSAEQNTTFSNISMTARTTWISTETNTNLSFRNTTFLNSNGSVFFNGTFVVPASTTVNTVKVNIRGNNVFVNSTNLSFLNQSAQINLLNTTSIFTGFTPGRALLVDFEDDGSFVPCGANCTFVSYNGSSLVFNVSHFTSFSSNDSFPVNVTNSSNLTSNISVNGDAIIINTSNVIFDCLGFTITGNGSGTGINVTGRTNVTIQNCNIINFNQNILFSGTNNSFVINNTLFNASQENIEFLNSNNNLANILRGFANSTGRPYFNISGGNNNTLTNLIFNATATGIGMNSGTQNNTVRDSIIIMPVSGIGLGVFADRNNFSNVSSASLSGTGSALSVQSGSDNFFDNMNLSSAFLVGSFQINSNGNTLTNSILTGSLGGFTIAAGSVGFTAHNNTISNSIIIATSGNALSIGFNTSNNTIIGSNITSGGTGIVFQQTLNGSTIANSIITAPTGVSWTTNSSNHTLSNVTINDSSVWLVLDSTTNLNNTLRNVSFLTPEGVIKSFSANLLNGSSVNTSNLDITQNRAFLNSSTNSFLNVSSQVTLNSVNSGVPYVDFNDDGIFSVCSPPQCVFQSFNGSTAVFNVSSFTSYSTSSSGNVTVTLSKTDSTDPVSPGDIFTYQINYSVTNGTSFNTVIQENYPSQLIFINATPAANASNNVWLAQNLTENSTFQINITVQANSSVLSTTTVNNTVNVSYENSTGSSFNINVTQNTTILVAFPVSVTTNTTLVNNVTANNSAFVMNTSNVTFDCNGFAVIGPGSGVAFNVTNANGVSIINCRVQNFASDILLFNSTFANVTNTTLVTPTTWLSADSTSNASLANVSFQNGQGILTLLSPVVMPSSSNVNNVKLNISLNRAFLNSSNLSFLNTSFRVRLDNLNVTTPDILADYEDDNIFQLCDVCTFISYNGSTLIFDVSHFTTYTSVESGVNFTITKTASPDPVTPGSQVTYTITVTVNSGFASNITVVENPPAELAFVTSTPTNVSANTWVLQNLSTGQSAQINATYNVSANFTGTINNSINVSFQNSTNGTITTQVNSTSTASTGGGGSAGQGGGGGGGGSAAICPPFCQYPENRDLPVCRNNCPQQQSPVTQPAFPNFPISESSSSELTQPKEETTEIVGQAPETPKEENAIEQKEEKSALTSSFIKFGLPVILGIIILVIILSRLPRHPKDKFASNLKKNEERIKELERQLRK